MTIVQIIKPQNLGVLVLSMIRTWHLDSLKAHITKYMT